ncbi:hypothetical protein C0991_003266, partial [Blastosporella zonata]
LDAESFVNAQGNVRANGLDERIRVVKVEAPGVQNDDEGPASKKPLHNQGPQFGFDGIFGGDKQDENEKEIEAPHTTSASETASSSQTLPHPTPRPTLIPIQFTMCNPPFYSSASDVLDSEAGKELGAFGACTGAPVEMITPGGEAAFVGGMVRESVSGLRGVSMMDAGDVGVGVGGGEENKTGRGKRRRVEGSAHPTGDHDSEKATAYSSSNKIHPSMEKEITPRWYTSMLGKMNSVVEVVDIFRELGITNYAITEFVQGQTRRWAVGWCVGGWRLSDDVARLANPNPTLARLLPPRNTLRFDVTTDKNEDGFATRVRLEGVLNAVEGTTVTEVTDAHEEGAVVEFVVSVPRDTWSRNARRKRKREEGNDREGGPSTKEDNRHSESVLAVVCAAVLRRRVGANVKEKAKEAQTDTEMEMEVRWMYGEERSLLESFASHVARKFLETIRG